MILQADFSRTALLLGEDALARLAQSRVVVFGLGGVGGMCVEALARGGIGHLTIVDGDTVTPSNINRQILALGATIGRQKALVCAERILTINESASVIPLPIYYDAQTAEQIDFSKFDYAADAIDSVTSKLLIIQRAKDSGTPVISCMGTGNKLNPMGFRVADIADTSVCPLARVMRREVRRRGLGSVKAVYSTETPCPVGGSAVPGSVSFVPPAAGLLMAREIIMDLLK